MITEQPQIARARWSVVYADRTRMRLECSVCHCYEEVYAGNDACFHKPEYCSTCITNHEKEKEILP